MDTGVRKKEVISSLFWKTLERGGAQGISFFVQLFLARLLLPEDYGLIALVTIFITLANVFVQSGFNTALIQKKDADNLDFSSVFYLSFIIAFFLYIILFFTAPFIARFYEEPQLKLIIRILSLTLFFGSFNSIQIAYISRNLMFKKLFFSSFGASLISGFIGIVLATQGAGVWALVTQQLVNQVVISIILLFVVKWRPERLFSIERVKTLFNFGSKLLASSLLNTVYDNARGLIIGVGYDPKVLGVYNRGKQFPQFIATNIDGSIQSVMLPTLSAAQDDKKQVKNMLRRSIMISSYFMFPIMMGLGVVATPMIRFLLTDTWLPAVPFLQIFCIVYALMPLQSANLQAINAIGRSDIFLQLEIIKKIIGVAIIFITIPLGVYGMAWGTVISSVIATVINAYPNAKLLDYKYFEQLKDIFPNLLIAAVMGLGVHLFSYLNINTLYLLLFQVIFGISSYFGLSALLKIESFNYIMTTIKELIYSRRGEK